MAGATLTTLTHILKELYLPPVVEQLNSEVLLLQRLETRSEEIVGKAAYIPVHFGRSSGIGARAEDGALPSAGNQEYLRLTYDLKYLYGRIRVTGPSMAKTASEAGAFLQALRSEIEGVRTDLRKDVARQIYGDGTAAFTTASNAGSSTTVTLGSDEPLRKGYLTPNAGILVDIGTASDYDSKISGASISSYNLSTPSITISSAVDLSSGGPFYVIRSGGAASSTSVYEIDAGLQKLVSTSAGQSVGGLSSSTYTWWDNIRDTSGGALTQDRMLQLWNQVRIAGGDPSLALTSFGGLRAYFNQLQSQIRYVNDQVQSLRGGFRALDFNGMPLVADVDAPFGRLYLLTEKHIKVFSNRDWHFIEEDGNVLKWVVGYDAFEAVLRRYMNLGIDRRNVQAVMTFTDSTGA